MEPIIYRADEGPTDEQRTEIRRRLARKQRIMNGWIPLTDEQLEYLRVDMDRKHRLLYGSWEEDDGND